MKFNNKLVVKKFYDLSVSELFQILKLRQNVFIVEQNCIYKDIDNIDKISYHVMILQKKLVSYLRFYNVDSEVAIIGRVVTEKKFRNKKNANYIIKQSIKKIKENREIKLIKISAQLHLKSFYELFNFKSKGDSYLEDNIPHIEMHLNI